jgi:hypothetical protein
MASIEIQEAGPDLLSRYATIPIRFTVESVLRIETVDQGLGGLVMVEEKVASPYIKDYDSQGCTLGAIHRYAYAAFPDVADEAMLLWYLDL